jgi:hypothetical protein
MPAVEKTVFKSGCGLGAAAEGALPVVVMPETVFHFRQMPLREARKY